MSDKKEKQKLLQDKVETIIEIIKKNNLKPTNIQKEVNVNASGIYRLINGKIKKPHSSTVNILYDYLMDGYTLENEKKKPKCLNDFTPREIAIYVMNNESIFNNDETWRMWQELNYYRFKDLMIKT